MTEAAHQMASNPLPPAARKPGSVGPRHRRARSASWTTAGSHLPPGERGEVVIQGPNVIRGYENNPEANATSFVDGWFRTGDQGFLDADGYLTLVGRIKELINRGGEKISPREIDEVLLAHPAVAEAVCFGVPHPTWGEEVAAAVVAARARRREAELLAFCRERLADFKRPKQIHITETIPRTATGKIQRGVVAEAFAQQGVVRIVIAGAGAIGGYIGARLAQAGADVVLFARGPHLRAMQERGLRVISPDGDFEVRPQVTGDLATIGRADVVVPRRQGARPDGAGAAAAAAASAPTPSSSARRTASRGGISRATAASSTDCGSSASIPGGVDRRGDRAARASSDRWPISRPTSSSPASSITPKAIASASASRTAPKSERARKIAEALIAAGFRCPVTTRFRHEIWVKLLGNVAFNPISALTGGTLEELVRHPDVSKRRPRADGGDRGGGGAARASSCRSRSISGWPAPKRSNTPCCRAPFSYVLLAMMAADWPGVSRNMRKTSTATISITGIVAASLRMA